jgi:hypothetical protein
MINIKSLQAQLNATKLSHNEALSEIELYKLKLLSNKKAEWLTEVSKKGIVYFSLISGSTRDMIRKDKQRWKTKSYQVENLTNDQARNVLNVSFCKYSYSR